MAQRPEPLAVRAASTNKNWQQQRPAIGDATV
jgi:hypothetical protein